MPEKPEHLDYDLITQIVEPDCHVLDLGCGDGELLSRLVAEKNARVQGIEFDGDAIQQCVEKGLAVFHGDVDSGLPDWPDGTFDYVILNQSLQQVKRVEFVIQEALRVGRKVIVGFPNFANWEARFMLCVRGQAPFTPALPYEWFSTPNIRFLSLKDFKRYCQKRNIRLLRMYGLGRRSVIRFFPNVFAVNALAVVTRAER